MKKEPNDRQIRLAKYMAENVGISMGQAMKNLGYSENYPNRKLVKVVDEGLSANRVISAMKTDKQATGATADFIEVPDHAVRHRFVETALKMKGKLIERQDVTSGNKKLEGLVIIKHAED